MVVDIVKKLLVVGIILLLVCMSILSTGTIVEKSYVSTNYIPHDPIFINGNDNFTSENGVTGGLGTSNDPYIIEGWDINASSHDGITIRNVSIFFIIRDCYIHDGVIGNNDGIVFINVTNGIIEDTTITDNINGVMFHPQHPGKQNSEKNDICNNLITSNKYCGINFEHTGKGHHCNNNIFNNTISSNNMGIYIIMSEENQIFYNNFISNGLGISLDMCIGGGDNNKIHQNNFINNSEHAFSIGPNKWFKFDFFKSRGNYWDDWEGLRFKYTRFFPFLLPYKIPDLRFQFDWFPAQKPYDIEV